MTSEPLAANGAPNPAPKPDPEHPDQEAAQDKSKQKRQHTDDDRNTEFGAQPKRAKSAVEDDDVAVLNGAAKLLLKLVSPSPLKTFCVEALEDVTLDLTVRDLLLSHNTDILHQARAESKKERDAIIVTARRAVDEIVHKAIIENDGKCECGEWPAALLPSLSLTQDLIDRGLLLEGPQRAWEALLKISAFCYGFKDESVEASVEVSGPPGSGWEEFHKQVDELMFAICKHQEKNVSWLQNGRKQEVWGLREKAESISLRSLENLYGKTLLFFEQLCK